LKIWGAATLERLEGREALEGLKLATVLKCLERSEAISNHRDEGHLSPRPWPTFALAIAMRIALPSS
jgi:hypothetical protein